ncbi:MAG: hypothetical protein U0670_19390 [Anaerolineae bacterium]
MLGFPSRKHRDDYLDRTLYHANIRLNVQEVLALVMAVSAPFFFFIIRIWSIALYKLVRLLPDRSSAADIAVTVPVTRRACA